jgi:hypothetical protein
VSDYWTQKVVSWFPKHEIQQMAMMFGSQETIHAVAYSYLNETLGLDNFEAFLHEPATAQRFDNLIAYEGTETGGHCKIHWQYSLLSLRVLAFTVLLLCYILSKCVIYLRV